MIARWKDSGCWGSSFFTLRLSLGYTLGISPDIRRGLWTYIVHNGEVVYWKGDLNVAFSHQKPNADYAKRAALVKIGDLIYGLTRFVQQDIEDTLLSWTPEEASTRRCC